MTWDGTRLQELSVLSPPVAGNYAKSNGRVRELRDGRMGRNFSLSGNKCFSSGCGFSVEVCSGIIWNDGVHDITLSMVLHYPEY